MIDLGAGATVLFCCALVGCFGSGQPDEVPSDGTSREEVGAGGSDSDVGGAIGLSRETAGVCAPGLGECETDNDCAPSEVCASSPTLACVRTWVDVSALCEDGSADCRVVRRCRLPCSTTVDCPGRLACDGVVCQDCATDLDCAPGTYCSPPPAPRCSDSFDCRPGEFCAP